MNAPASVVVRRSPTPLYALASRLPRPVWLAYMAVRLVFVMSAFAGFWVGAVLLAWFVLPLVALSSRRPLHACLAVVRASWRLFHGYMAALRLFAVRFVGGPPALPGDRPVVLVANHTTLVDVTAIMSRIPGVCAVAKSTYYRTGYVRRLLELAGFVEAGGTVAGRAGMVPGCLRRLEDGFHVLIFPEGERSPEGGMRAFQRGAFEIACRSNALVVPLVLRCDPSALRKGQRFWQQPDTCAHLTITMGQPFDPADYGRGPKASRQLRDAVEAYYRAELGLEPRPAAPASGPTAPHGSASGRIPLDSNPEVAGLGAADKG